LESSIKNDSITELVLETFHVEYDWWSCFVFEQTNHVAVVVEGEDR
jgi:hypothetical protein